MKKSRNFTFRFNLKWNSPMNCAITKVSGCPKFINKASTWKLQITSSPFSWHPGFCKGGALGKSIRISPPLFFYKFEWHLIVHTTKRYSAVKSWSIFPPGCCCLSCSDAPEPSNLDLYWSGPILWAFCQIPKSPSNAPFFVNSSFLETTYVQTLLGSCTLQKL